MKRASGTTSVRNPQWARPRAVPDRRVLGRTADTIDGTAAIVCARRTYAAIASAQPVDMALAQAKAAMRLTTPEDADLPQVAVRDASTLTNLCSSAHLAPHRRPTHRSSSCRSNVLLVEAIDRDGSLGEEHLPAQCEHHRRLLGVQDHDFEARSHSDLLRDLGRSV